MAIKNIDVNLRKLRYEDTDRSSKKNKKEDIFKELKIRKIG